MEREAERSPYRLAEDRRRRLVELTDAGARRVADAEAALGAVEDEVLSALSADERTTLYELLQRATAGHMADCSAAAAAPPPDC